MVLKKPYGLMIKHFKLIHVLLLLFSGFVIWQIRPLVSFFNDFVANNYTATVTDNMASAYINVLLYPALILILLLLGMLFILLHYKKKPTKIYSIAIIYYLILFVAIIISAGLLTSLEETLWSTTSARMYRDISAIIVLPQYIFIPFWLIRALGFNIKQFNFQTDLAELDLSQKDSEEIEISLGFETYKYQRMVRRFIREFKYYFTENKFLMIVIFAITLVIMLYLFFSNFETYEEKINIGQQFNVSNLNVKVEDSIITNINYSGSTLNKYYLLLRVTIINPSEEDKYSLEYNKFFVYSGKDYYEPVTKAASQFIDYGESYYGSDIYPKKTHTIVLPYEIPENKISNGFYLGIYKETAKKKEYRNRMYKINLNPIIINENVIVGNLTKNQEINFNNTYLNKTTLTIKDALVTDRYVYNYESCVKDNCNSFMELITPAVKGTTRQSLLVLDYDFKLDNDSSFAKFNTKISAFANSFFKVRYTVNGINYTRSISAVENDKVKDKLILQTDAQIEQASKVDLLITIRNKTFVVNVLNESENK